MVTGLKGNRSDLKMEATQSKSFRIIWWLTRERERDEGKSKSFTLQGFPERSMKSLISMSLARRKVPILLALEAPASLDSIMFNHERGRDWKPISNLGFAERDLSTVHIHLPSLLSHVAWRRTQTTSLGTFDPILII